MNLLRQWVSLLTIYIDASVNFIVSRNESISSSYLGQVLSPLHFSCMAGKTFEQLERAILNGTFRDHGLDPILDSVMTWLHDIATYGRSSSLQQCFTYNTLKYHDVFSDTELRSVVRSHFVNGEGYIDIDIVLVKQQSRVCVVMLLILAMTVPAVSLTSELSSPAYLASLSTGVLLFAVFCLVVSLFLVTSFALLVMYRVYLTGIMPLAVAQTIYENREEIEKLGPRCFFKTRTNARQAY